MTEGNYKIASKIMEHYGAEQQKDVLIEECAELIQATEKTRRMKDAPDFTANMVEEMADVFIMLLQFTSIMNEYWSKLFNVTVESKLKRQSERIEGERLD